MRINKLSANPKKNEFMLIGHPRIINEIETLASLKLNGTETSENSKPLGIIVADNLNWKEHFKSLKGKAASGLSAFKKTEENSSTI